MKTGPGVVTEVIKIKCLVLKKQAGLMGVAGQMAFSLACSRLRDGGGKSFSNKKCEKRAGLGRDRAAEISLPFFPPPPPPFPSRARLIFALLVLIPSHYTI